MKRLFLLLLAVVIFLTFIGCSKENEDEYCVIKKAIYSGNDIDEFIVQWKAAQGNVNEKNGLYVNRASIDDKVEIKVPKLQAKEYELYHMCVNEFNYVYNFAPKDKSDVKRTNKRDIYVYVSRTDYTFDDYVSEKHLTPINGYAYNEELNEWVIDDSNGMITVTFPDDIVLTAPEQISEYFTFETHTAGGRNDHIVS